MMQSNFLFDDSHIFHMTDDTGMFQHSQVSVPNLAKGYTTDDNARALIMAVMLYEQQQREKFLVLVYRYLAFVLYAQNEEGCFRNFMTYERRFTEREGSEECFGRCLWALGYMLASQAMPEGVKAVCADAIERAVPNISQHIRHIRGQAYVIIALDFIKSSRAHTMMNELAVQLAGAFEKCARDTAWRWFEDKLTYDNAVLPWAMFIAYRAKKQTRFLQIARDSLAFFDKMTFRDGFFRAVGCKGWWLRGKEPALYDEQPVEAAMSTLAHLAAFDVTGEQEMLSLAQKSFAWYAGENCLGKSMLDPDSGGCFDGITAHGVNRNQGAESIVGYVIAGLALAKYKCADRKKAGKEDTR